MSFLFPSVAMLGAGLVLLPLAVHLISRRRRRRIAWAAMDFLLDSNKKNQNRSRLEEWLLLLLRMLAVGLAALLAAAPQLPKQLSHWFEGTVATHLVLLDDSYSMGERTDVNHPWQTADEAIRRLMKRCETTRAEVHLIRFTDSLNHQDPALVSTQSADSLELKLGELATGPVEALRQAHQFLASESMADKRCYVTVLSDFRQHDYADEAQVDSSLESLAAQADEMLLAPCTDPNSTAANLTLVDFSLAPGPRALGVEMTAQLTVENPGTLPMDKVLVQVQRDQRLVISLEIGPFSAGETLQKSFPLMLSEEGPQTFLATLPSDALLGDNHRQMVLDLPPSRRVLILDGSQDGQEGLAFAAALAPQPTIRTGWRTQLVRKKKFDSLGDLAETDLVFLLEGPQLGMQAKSELLRFVQKGGGLLNVIGPQVDRAFYNTQLTTEEFPLMPVMLDLPTQAPWSEPDADALKVSDHPTLRILAGQRNGFLPLIRIGMYQAVNPLVDKSIETDTLEKEPSGLPPEVLLELSDGSPLLLEHSVGEGRVLTLLTTMTAQDETLGWSNVATLPIFPVLANEMAGWLSQSITAPHTVTLGEQVPHPADAEKWSLEEKRLESHLEGRVEGKSDSATWEPLREETIATAKPLLSAGTYRVTSLQRGSASGGGKPTSFAANPDAREGHLVALKQTDLLNRFGSFAKVIPADELFEEVEEQRSWQPMLIAGMLLFGLLIAERLLATRCSYLSAVPAKSSAKPSTKSSSPSIRRGTA